jgi:hypothetical protein
VSSLEFRVLAACDDKVVADGGRLSADEVSDALPAQPEPVHNTHSASGARRNRLSMMGVILPLRGCLERSPMDVRTKIA